MLSIRFSCFRNDFLGSHSVFCLLSPVFSLTFVIALFLLLLEIRVKRGSQAQSLGLMATRKKEGGSWLPPSLMRVAILI